MAKEIKTRIILKHDTWSAWNNSTVEGQGANLVLKAGEIGICTIPADTNAGQSTSEPVVLFKVGDGINPFSKLAWTSAKAADVHGWAKQSAAEFADNFLAMVDSDGKTVRDKLDGIFATDAELNAAVESCLNDAKAYTDDIIGIDFTATDAEGNKVNGSTVKEYVDKKDAELAASITAASQATTNALNLKADITYVDEKDNAIKDIIGALEDISAAGIDFTIDETSVTKSIHSLVVALGSTRDLLGASKSIDGAPLEWWNNADVVTAVNSLLTKVNAIDELVGDGQLNGPISIPGMPDDRVVSATQYINAIIAFLNGFTETDENGNQKYPTIKAYIDETDAATLTSAKDYTDTVASGKANVSDVYTKTEVDGFVQDAKDYSDGQNDQLESTINGKLDLKADASSVYTKEEADGKFLTEHQSLANYYTKAEADAEFTTADEVITAIDDAIAKVSSTDTLDGITDLVNYVNENASDLTALISEVYGAASITETSRIDGAVANAEAAVETANGAATTAGNAATVAGEAKTIAEEAKTAATTAQNSAAASAEAAAASAQLALDYAGAAEDKKDAAVIAKNEAEAAKSAAVSAQEAAESARDTAAQHKADAESAKSLAESAKADAETAKGAAEAAQGAAEAAQSAAETAKADAEAAKSAAATSASQAADSAQLASDHADAASDEKDAAIAAKEAAEAARDAALDANSSATAIANEAKGLATTANSNAAEALNKVNSLTTDDIDGGEEIWIFDCGTATTVI